MKIFSLKHLSNQQLSHDLIAACIRDRRITAWVLAHIAEFDSRELYLEAGYKSMHAYCVGVLHFSDSAVSGGVRRSAASDGRAGVGPAPDARQC